MTRSVTIPLEEYEEIKEKEKRFDLFNSRMKRGSEELEVFLNWIIKKHDLQEDIEAFNKESNDSQIIKPVGYDRYKLVITGNNEKETQGTSQ